MSRYFKELVRTVDIKLPTAGTGGTKVPINCDNASGQTAKSTINDFALWGRVALVRDVVNVDTSTWSITAYGDVGPITDVPIYSVTGVNSTGTTLIDFGANSPCMVPIKSIEIARTAGAGALDAYIRGYYKGYVGRSPAGYVRGGINYGTLCTVADKTTTNSVTIDDTHMLKKYNLWNEVVLALNVTSNTGGPAGEWRVDVIKTIKSPNQTAADYVMYTKTLTAGQTGKFLLAANHGCNGILPAPDKVTFTLISGSPTDFDATIGYVALGATGSLASRS